MTTYLFSTESIRTRPDWKVKINDLNIIYVFKADQDRIYCQMYTENLV